MDHAIRTALVGIGATLVMDLWTLVRRRAFGTPLPDYALVGRWLSRVIRGHLLHRSMATVPPVRGERTIGWIAHYLIGIAFAALLPVAFGTEWLQSPRPGPALLVGVVTVLAPFLVMQPAMGAGLAARRTARPNAARLQSLATHAIFGLGLYAAGWLALRVFPF